MALLYDDQNKKNKLARPVTAPDTFARARAQGNLGPLGETIARGMSNFAADLSARNAAYNAPTGARFNTGLGVLGSPKPAPVAAPAPVRNPVQPTRGVSLPGRVPDSPRPVAPPPSFAGVQGSISLSASAQPTGIPRTVVNGVPTYSGLGFYAPPGVSAPAPAVSRPLLSTPSISPVMTPGAQNQSEDRAQREGRQAALGNLDLQDFLLRGKTTRSARDAVSDNARVRADLVNTAGNQAVALKNSNLDAQTRIDTVGLQNQGENDRALIDLRGTNERTSLIDAGDTERERIKLERPSLLTDRDGGYLLVNPMQGVARPVLSNGQQVRGLVDGELTPVDKLASLQTELAASQQSLTPDVARIDDLERQVDALRRPNARPLPGDVVKGYRFRGGDPNIEANWERIGGAP